MNYITFYLPDRKTRERIKTAAKKQNMTLSAFIREVVEKAVEKKRAA